MLGAGGAGNIYNNICESCTFCDTKLCNNEGIEVKSTLTEKSTTKIVKKPETTEKPESGEKLTPKTVVKPKIAEAEKPKSNEVAPPTKTDDVDEPEGGEERAGLFDQFIIKLF
jgi:hypothetical protein